MLSEDQQDTAEKPPAASGDVHVGRDGWLFLTGGRNRVLEQYGRPGFSRKALWQWRCHLAERVRRSARLGAAYLHVVAPEKLTIYYDAVDGLAFDPQRAPALRLRRWLRGSTGARASVDLVGPMRAARWKAPLYRRTDSHWTFAGGELAYRTLLAGLGVAPRDDIAGRRQGEALPFTGDLGTKLAPMPVETAEACRFDSRARRIHANGLLTHFEALGRPLDAHIGAHAVFRNDDPAADPRRLVLFGDSYAQHRAMNATASLTPFLADTFREVHFLWSTSLDWDYLAEIRPDFVISEIAERFMIDLPVSNMRIESLARLALARKADA
ncbi:alginate O-acetyltransferase AlgX-related protein [Methylobacterium haplocladii]|uniref:AlgX/AlgJ SGNH hydrolase-like domain-containing protein n=1 Tax=Methylobacterium haplocladii TaxID=1176176 RepID=A0A512ITV7_9HYPH|nr:hypothetical protein [Methylobacterium haplocladii]GEP01131.1 hypothetical protein MHA02_35180 [Methylobacterium haplocladii]GJD82909.1 hypothetical protein HPGCJGGD_0771 [Methylobacterium haplocladii]GLS60444.1 hypothetical protein GCM10007887_31230 [Methylobacterium haplocladii]